MPKEIELPQFFDTVEKLYSIYQVPEDLQAKLLIPLLTDRAKSVIGRMSAAAVENYNELNHFLLTEFKLTPREYKNRFDSAMKNADETHVLFAARLRSLLMYYLSSRDLDNSFDKLCDLIISDRLKCCLPDGPLQYVLSLEGDAWFSPDRVATLADTYVNNRPMYSVPRTTAAKVASTATNVGTSFVQSKDHKTHSYSNKGGNVGKPMVKQCHRCQSTQHLVKACPRGRGFSGRGNYTVRPGLERAQVIFVLH